jgi:hypothetical protein
MRSGSSSVFAAASCLGEALERYIPRFVQIESGADRRVSRALDLPVPQVHELPRRDVVNAAVLTFKNVGDIAPDRLPRPTFAPRATLRSQGDVLPRGRIGIAHVRREPSLALLVQEIKLSAGRLPSMGLRECGSSIGEHRAATELAGIPLLQ